MNIAWDVASYILYALFLISNPLSFCSEFPSYPTVLCCLFCISVHITAYAGSCFPCLVALLHTSQFVSIYSLIKSVWGLLYFCCLLSCQWQAFCWKDTLHWFCLDLCIWSLLWSEFLCFFYLKLRLRSRQMALQLGALTTLTEDPGLIPIPCSRSQPSVIPVPGGPMSSSGVRRY